MANCRWCGAENQPHYRYCSACYRELGTSLSDPVVAVSPTGASASPQAPQGATVLPSSRPPLGPSGSTITTQVKLLLVVLAVVAVAAGIPAVQLLHETNGSSASGNTGTETTANTGVAAPPSQSSVTGQSSTGVFTTQQLYTAMYGCGQRAWRQEHQVVNSTTYQDDLVIGCMNQVAPDVSCTDAVDQNGNDLPACFVPGDETHGVFIASVMGDVMYGSERLK